MGINQVREVARADMNDQYTVTVFLAEPELELSPVDARRFAQEIIRAADSAEIAAAADGLRPVESSFVPPVGPTGEVVF